MSYLRSLYSYYFYALSYFFILSSYVKALFSYSHHTLIILSGDIRGSTGARRREQKTFGSIIAMNAMRCRWVNTCHAMSCHVVFIPYVYCTIYLLCYDIFVIVSCSRSAAPSPIVDALMVFVARSLLFKFMFMELNSSMIIWAAWYRTLFIMCLRRTECMHSISKVAYIVLWINSTVNSTLWQ